ncbi:MAG TPA: hypothetical protein VFU86_00055 [Terriglobales bacterium]|nr:hypothetical protein [Terriglobales bacterium]
MTDSFIRGLTVFVIAFLLSWLTARARHGKPHQLGNSLVFPIYRVVAYFYGVGFSLGMVLLIEGIQAAPNDKLVEISIGVAFAAFAVITWPKDVRVSPTGVEQKSWRGVTIAVPWDGILEVRKRKRDGTIFVKGTAKRTIEFTQFHVAKELFVKELLTHRGISVVQ